MRAIDSKSFFPFRMATQPRTKKKAGANEALDISNIIAAINSKTVCGTKIISAFADKFAGQTLLQARKRTGGNRGTHYDFDILIKASDSEEPCWKHVEHKGSNACQPIKPSENPWDAGVQFHNGGCEKYTLARKYAKEWYTMYIGSNVLKEKYGVQASVPTYEDWWLKDCKVQGKPKTPFGIELKEKAMKKNNGKSLLEERGPLLAALDITEEDKTTLIAEVLPIANDVLDQKDYWLTIRGDLNDAFHVAWNPKFVIHAIQNVIVTKNKDIELDFHCNDDFVFHGILRWGYGAGFSNLRLDLK